MSNLASGHPRLTATQRKSHPATYQDVIGAMDAARSAGVRVIGLPDRDLYRRR
jgi:hypothetical protein